MLTKRGWGARQESNGTAIQSDCSRLQFRRRLDKAARLRSDSRQRVDGIERLHAKSEAAKVGEGPAYCSSYTGAAVVTVVSRCREDKPWSAAWTTFDIVRPLTTTLGRASVYAATLSSVEKHCLRTKRSSHATQLNH